MSGSDAQPLLSLKIKKELDVVLSRRRARQIAYLLGYDSANQTRISTAVSEIARNAFVHAGGGRLDFRILDQKPPYRFVVVLTDHGPGIPQIEEILAGRTEHNGLSNVNKLVDTFLVENLPAGGTMVRFEKLMPMRTKAFSVKELDELVTSLEKLVAGDPVDEVQRQNQELLEALEQLSTKQIELDNMNLALERHNREMSTLNNSLELKVQERTNELVKLNAYLSDARDEAVRANLLKSQFVANVSHEIRTPMSGILGATELVLDFDSLEPDARELLYLAHSSAKNLMTVINDLLDFSKLEAGKSTLHENNFYMVSLVDEVIEGIIGASKQKGLILTESLPESLNGLQLYGDEGLLRRVFLNFLHNAVKFTDSGTVTISVEVLHEDNGHMTVKGSVKDTGIGIEDSQKSKLFQPFVQADGSNTRKYGGTGLGLSLSSGYIRLMGGKIGFESTKDVGSNFWFVVPLQKAISAEA